MNPDDPLYDPDMPLYWKGSDGQCHWVTEDHALEILKWFYDEWPGGFAEIEAAKRKTGEDKP